VHTIKTEVQFKQIFESLRECVKLRRQTLLTTTYFLHLRLDSLSSPPPQQTNKHTTRVIIDRFAACAHLICKTSLRICNGDATLVKHLPPPDSTSCFKLWPISCVSSHLNRDHNPSPAHHHHNGAEGAGDARAHSCLPLQGSAQSYHSSPRQEKGQCTVRFTARE